MKYIRKSYCTHDTSVFTYHTPRSCYFEDKIGWRHTLDTVSGVNHKRMSHSTKRRANFTFEIILKNLDILLNREIVL